VAFQPGLSSTRNNITVTPYRNSLWLALSSLLFCVGCRTPTPDDGVLHATIAAGRAQRLPYIIQSATILVEVEDTPKEQPTRRRTTYRYVYTLRPLKNIRLQDHAFSELLDNKVGQSMEYWPGPDPQRIEVFKPDTKGFQVSFAAPAGGTRTVVTGMTIHEALPLKRHRIIRGFDFGPNEFSVFYPNQEDYIAELTIVVSSNTTELKSKPAAAWRMPGNDAPPVFTPGARFAKEPPKWNGTTLSARFEQLRPGEIVGLEYSW
jgi:hypothetical protein